MKKNVQKMYEYVLQHKGFLKRLTGISALSLSGMIIISALVGGLFTAVDVSTNVVEAFNGDVIRLHVIANSDSEQDQALKLQVRDVVLAQVENEIGEVEAITDARELVEGKLPEIEAAAQEYVRSQGYDYNVRVDWGIFPFPTKTYGKVTLPAGDYRAVRVVIGEGAGHNWWCVMFPPLCFVDETKAEMPEESIRKLQSAKLLTDNAQTQPQFRIKFKILELFGNDDAQLVYTTPKGDQ